MIMAPTAFPPHITVATVELAALLALRPGSSAARATQRLGLGAPTLERVRAGAASMLDRGLAAIDVPGPDALGGETPAGEIPGGGERIVRPCGPGLVLAHVLSNPARWVTIVYGNPDGMSGSMVVDTAEASVGITPRADRSFVVTAFPPGYSGDSVIGASVLPYLDAGSPAMVSVTVQPAVGTERTLTLSRAPDGGWWRHDGPTGDRHSIDRPAAAKALGKLTGGS